MNIPDCPACGESHLEPSARSIVLNFDGVPHQIGDLECYRCSSCGEEIVSPDQSRRNSAKVNDHKRLAAGLLTGEQIRRIREALRISQSDASQLFGGGPHAFSKYERGEVIQSVSMDRLLRVAAAVPMVMSFLVDGNTADSVKNYSGVSQITGTISLNDPSFRSRELEGSPVVVSFRDWKVRKKAA